MSDELPFSKVFYFLDDKIIDYSLQERDLGIIMNGKLSFEDHHHESIPISWFDQTQLSFRN